MIAVRQLAKRYKKVHAVRDVTFEARDGEVTTLLGANGSGKSTTFRSIFGVVKPDSGSVSVDGIDVARRPQAARPRLGVCPDDFGLFPKLTADEHVRFFGRLHGLSGAALGRAADRACDLLTLEKLRRRRIDGFSLGERMKTALACAMVHQPSNLVMDEPMRGLDVVNIRLLRALIRQLRDAGVCVLMSSHVLSEVSLLSDVIVVIADGRSKVQGAPQTIAADYGHGDLEEAFLRLSDTGKADAA